MWSVVGSGGHDRFIRTWVCVDVLRLVVSHWLVHAHVVLLVLLLVEKVIAESYHLVPFQGLAMEMHKCVGFVCLVLHEFCWLGGF